MKLVLLGILIDELVRKFYRLIDEREELRFRLHKMEEEAERKQGTPVFVKFDYDKK